MNARETLLAMADYIEKHGFDPEWSRDGSECGCFAHAWNAVAAYGPLGNHILEIVGYSFEPDNLRAAGWTGPEVTADAVAACRIAADLETP